MNNQKSGRGRTGLKIKRFVAERNPELGDVHIDDTVDLIESRIVDS